MTNGEKIKEIFQNITERFTNIDEYTNKPTRVEISVGMHILTTISVDVWNAEYKEPTAKNNLAVDCISREQALNEFCIYNPYDSIGVDKVRNCLKALPSIRPKGHWIDRELYDADRWKCSECGRTEPYKENYCPNCGAKMESEE